MTTKQSKNKFQFTLEFNTLSEAMNFIKVLKMLYGRDVAERVFTSIMKQCYNVDSASLINFKKV